MHHRAIIASPHENAKLLAKAIGCSTNTSEDLISCLKKETSAALLDAHLLMQNTTVRKQDISAPEKIIEHSRVPSAQTIIGDHVLTGIWLRQSRSGCFGVLLGILQYQFSRC